VVQGDKLYEMWRADIATAGSLHRRLHGGVGPEARLLDASSAETLGRGNQCTSADAAGFPVTDLTFTADEVRRARSTTPSASSCPTTASARASWYCPATHSGVGKGTPTADTVPTAPACA
jgi:serine/threonine-protein kinase